MTHRDFRSFGSWLARWHKLRSLLALPVAISCLTANAAASADPWPSRPAGLPSTCPQTLILEPQDATTYIFAAEAKQPVTASLEATLYTAKRTYELTLPTVNIDRPDEARNDTLRSAGVLIQAMPDEPYLGIALAAVGTSCGSSHAIVSQKPAAASTAAPSRRTKSLMASLSRDTMPASPLVPAPVSGSQPPQCAIPFAKPRTDVLSMPEFPAIAREQGAVGLAYVDVELDQTGKVVHSEIRKSAGNAALDSAAVQAARATTYIPAIFDCRPDDGSYEFHAQFTI